MGIQGMELFAIGVVVILFMAVLKQFGILEPISSFEGKADLTISWQQYNNLNINNTEILRLENMLLNLINLFYFCKNVIYYERKILFPDLVKDKLSS